SFNQGIGITLIILFLGFVLFSIGKYWYADFIYQTGKLEYQLQRFSDSVRDSKIASDISPDEPIYHDNLSRIYAQLALSFIDQKDASSASKLVTYSLNESDIALSLSARNLSIRRDRIVILSQLSQFNPKYVDEAIKFTNDTIPLAPTDPKILLYLGKIYANSGRLDEAISTFQKAIELKPDYIDARFSLGVVYKAKKDIKNAKIQFEYILTYLSPNNEEVKKELQDIK
ncbi:MAG TPA: tetratricopeptide repeat protein, partial [Candidatus Saccharimonadales bacterium]|nr:tetratricopeptide repeat protein [Candidatus Saccharimonadales bacterium]